VKVVSLIVTQILVNAVAVGRNESGTKPYELGCRNCASLFRPTPVTPVAPVTWRGYFFFFLAGWGPRS